MGIFLDDLLDTESGTYLGHSISISDQKEHLRDATVIFAQNVANLFYEDKRDEWSLSDFPTIAPPDSNMFIEWRIPKAMNVDGEIVDTNWEGTRIGVHFRSMRTKDVEKTRDFRWPPAVTALMPPEVFQIARENGWVVLTKTYISYNSQIYLHPFMTSFLLDETGRFIDQHGALWHGFLDIPGVRDLPDNHKLSVGVMPACFAIGLMHCKNVRVVRHDPPKAVQDKRMKKGKDPISSYHILEIEPMRKVLSTEGNRESVGLKRSVHICRGHFKDYRDGVGLFGKVRGIFWWENHARGSTDKGVVSKDYRIKHRR